MARFPRLFYLISPSKSKLQMCPGQAGQVMSGISKSLGQRGHDRQAWIADRGQKCWKRSETLNRSLTHTPNGSSKPHTIYILYIYIYMCVCVCHISHIIYHISYIIYHISYIIYLYLIISIYIILYLYLSVCVYIFSVCAHICIHVTSPNISLQWIWYRRTCCMKGGGAISCRPRLNAQAPQLQKRRVSNVSSCPPSWSGSRRKELFKQIVMRGITASFLGCCQRV